MKINRNTDPPQFPSNPLPTSVNAQPLTEEQVLAQIEAFRQYAQQLSLPLSNPHAFFTAFISRFQDGSACPQRHQALALGLLLDYRYLGNAVFDGVELKTLPDFHAIQPLFAEFLQHEEWNEKLDHYRRQLLQTKPADSGQPVWLNDYPVIPCMDIFRKLRSRKNSRIPLSGLAAAQAQLELGLRLEKLARGFAGNGRLPELTQCAQGLAALLRPLSPKEVAALPPDLRGFAYAVDEDAAHDEQQSKRNSCLLEQLAALVQRSEAEAGEGIAQLEKLTRLMDSLLQQRFLLPPYRFFAHAFSVLEHNDCLRPLAPVYLWRLFSAHGESATAKRIDDKIFAPARLFDLEPRSLSGERTSIALQEADYEAFEALCALYQQQLCGQEANEAFSRLSPSEQPRELYLRGLLDLPMCEFIFQRITRTQLAGSSTTSITGEQRKKRSRCSAASR